MAKISSRSRWSPEEQTLWLGISTVRRLVEKPETVYWNGRCSYSTAQQFLSWPFICLTEMQGRMGQDAINELSQELCKSQKWTKPKHPHRLRWDDYVVVREYTTAWKWNESHKQKKWVSSTKTARWEEPLKNTNFRFHLYGIQTQAYADHGPRSQDTGSPWEEEPGWWLWIYLFCDRSQQFFYAWKLYLSAKKVKLVFELERRLSK